MRVILFFDGDCGLCHFAVKWIAKRDIARRIFFAPLQGETAKQLLLLNRPDSLVLYEDGLCTFYGKAATRAALYLSYPARALGLLHYLPSFLLDPLYRVVARNRQKIFGKSSCLLPSAICPTRFLP